MTKHRKELAHFGKKKKMKQFYSQFEFLKTVGKNFFSNGTDCLKSHTVLGRITLTLIQGTFLADKFAALVEPAICLLYGVIHLYWLYKAIILQLNIIIVTFWSDIFFASIIKMVAVQRKSIAKIFLHLLSNIYNGIYLCISYVICGGIRG